MSAITAKASRKMKKYAVLTREPRCFLGSFDFSWEQRKLGDIGKARSGVGFPDADQGGLTGVPFFKVSDMNSDGNENEMTVANNYVTTEQIADHRWSPITELPAIFFAKVGAAVMLNRKRLCRFPFLLDNNTMAYSLSPTKWDADFAKALFGTVDLTSLVQVGALPSYNAGDVESMEIYLPSLLEQEQIGAYFKHLDNLITLHQRKCALLFSSFQALISMMFTTSTFSWEQRKVGDLLIERNQQAPMSDEYPLMAFIANEGVAPKGERYDRSALVTDTVNKLYKKTEKGDFIYSSNNLETGSIGLNKYGKACISPVYSIFEPTGIADSDFLGRRLVRKDFINAMVKWRQGVIYGQWRIHESDFLKIEIPVPSVEEQRKIGAYLDQLDNLITLHQRKCISFTGRAGRLISTVNKKRITSSWEQRKLGDISEIKTGPFGSTLHADDYVSDGTPIITTEHFKTGTLPRSKNGLPQVSDADYKRLTAYTLDDGDIVFSRVGSVDINALITPFQSNWLFSGRVLRVRPQTNISSQFLHTRLETGSIKADIRARAVGQTMPSINTEILKITPLVLPTSAAEQEQIGSYFAAIDNLITLHQRKPFLMKWRTSDANRNQTNRLVL